ncbi:MAG: PAS domain S-box protein [Dethiosulfovibrio sp.]|nr:PAS domain S-box protein [Dethiosulfovibrio sp.]
MTVRTYSIAVVVSLLLLLGGISLLDSWSGDRMLEYRAVRELDHISLAARSISDRLSMSLSHFRSLSYQVVRWGDGRERISGLIDGLAYDEGQHFPSLLNLSWIGYDGRFHVHSSKNRVIFQQALSWGQIYMSRYTEGWRDGWVAPFTVAPGLKTMGMVYPLWSDGAFLGVFVVTLDLDLLLGHIAHHIGESGGAWILDGLGRVVFSKDQLDVGKNVFGDGQSLFSEVGYLREDVVHRSSGKDLERLLVWHSSRIQARKLVLIKSVSPTGLGAAMPYRIVLSSVVALILISLSLTFISARERAWEELAAAEKRYLAVVEAQTELVIRFRPDWTITFVNQAYCRFFGMSRQDLIGVSMRKLVSSDDRSHLRPIVDSLSIGEGKTSEWTQALELHRTKTWVRWNLSLVSGAWSVGPEIQAVGRDITSTVKLQKELLRRQEALSAILESAPVPICLASPDGAVEMVNKAGATIKDHPSVSTMARQVIDRRYGLYGQELTLKDEMGDERIITLNVVPYGEPPHVLGALVAGLDVTLQRAMARQMLEERDARYRRILDAIGDAVLLCRKDQDGRYMVDLANPVAEDLTGRRGDDLLNLPLSDIFNAPSLRKIEGLRAVSAPLVMIGGLKRPWGDTLPVEMSLMAFKEDGPTMLIVMRDISERIKSSSRERAYARQLRNLIGRLDRLDQEKRREMASYLHDVVGQNLASVKIGLGLAKRSLGPGAEVLDGAISLLNQVIDDTRAMTFDLASPLLEELGFVPALERLCEKLKDDHGLSVHISHDGTWGDLDKRSRDVLFRAVRELLINVAKHAQVDIAQVSLSTEGRLLTAIVSDRGRGYDPDELDRAGANYSFGLFGLRERLAGLGGELICRSSPGNGTEVTVRMRREGGD